MLLHLLAYLFLVSCNLHQKKDEMPATGKQRVPSFQKQFYGMIGADSVHQYTLSNSKGMQVKLLDYGATVTNIIVADKEGRKGDVVLGFDSLPGYLQTGNPYFGSVVGRYANRIANAKFTLDGKTFQLAANNNGNSLHGGLKGFDKKIWKEKSHETGEELVTIDMEYKSKDGEQGYPGNVTVTVSYTLTDDNDLIIYYIAATDKATPVNLTSHCYFNLSAGTDSTILDHVLMIKADRYTEVNDKLIPTGKLPEVKGTPMDFNSPKRIGDDIGKVSGGFDHNWVLSKKKDSLQMIASLYHPASGRYMEVLTTQPGIQFYSGNFLDNTLTGKQGKKYTQHAALCLETQHFPDSPNQPSFPSTILKPGEEYRQTTIYKFSNR